MNQRLLPLLVALTLTCASEVLADPGQRPQRPWERARNDLRQLWTDLSIEGAMALGEVRGRLTRPPRAPDWTPRSYGKGRLERGPGGIPVLYLEGTPEEMGTQHGTLMKGELEGMQAYVTAFVGRRQLPGAKRRAARLFREHAPERYLREARALARAAGLDEEDVLFAQWFTDLYRNFACSTLAAPSDDGPLLARNLDFPGMGFLERYSVVVVARPRGKRPWISVGWPGLVGVLSGQNEGLALSVMVVHDSSGVRSGVPFQMAFRRLLEESGSAAEAEALMREQAITVGNNLMLVDRGGDARVLELHPDGLQSRKAEPGRRLVSTNHFVSRGLRRPRASIGYASSRKRYRAVEEVCPLTEEGPVSVARAKQALTKARMSYTMQSMVFLPGRGEVEVAFAKRAPAKTFVRLGRDALLGGAALGK